MPGVPDATLTATVLRHVFEGAAYGIGRGRPPRPMPKGEDLMGSYRLDGTEIRSHEVVGTHGYRTCDHPGCSTIIEHWEPYGDGDGDKIRYIPCTTSGMVLDTQWRWRCDAHNDRVTGQQLKFF